MKNRNEYFFSSQSKSYSNRINFNHGTLSQTPTEVLGARDHYAAEFESCPTLALAEAWPRMWEVNQIVAKFFGAKPENFFLRENVTQALNVFLMGLKIPQGSELLYTNLEYGAIINILRLRAEREGFILKSADLPLDHALTDDEMLNSVLSQVTKKTKVILVSHIFSATGEVFPIAKLGWAMKDTGVSVVVDGAHAPGSVALELSQYTGLAFYAGNLHKWMLGPKGTGFGYIYPEFEEQWRPHEGSWTIFEIGHGHDRYASGNLFAKRTLQSNCIDFANFFALADLITWWQAAGWDTIQTQRLQLRQTLASEITRRLGWTRLTREIESTPLVAFQPPTKWQGRIHEVHQFLYHENGLVMALPSLGKNNFCMRFSLAHTNTTQEIEKVLEIFSQL